MNVKDMKALRFISTTKKLLLFIFLCGIIQGAFSQKLTTNNWYFGNTINGIKFNRGTSKAEATSNKATPFGTGGSAVATDPATANLLFYTDGARVYDASHKQMPNGTGLSGNTSANQPSVICKCLMEQGYWEIRQQTNLLSFRLYPASPTSTIFLPIQLATQPVEPSV